MADLHVDRHRPTMASYWVGGDYASFVTGEMAYSVHTKEFKGNLSSRAAFTDVRTRSVAGDFWPFNVQCPGTEWPKVQR